MTIILAALIGLSLAGLVNQVTGGKIIITLLAGIAGIIISTVFLIIGGLVLGGEATLIMTIVVIVFLLFKTNQLKKKD